MRGRLFGLLVSGVLLMSLGSHAAPSGAGNAYDFSFRGLLDGQPLPLSQFKGKVLLVVNTASECGFTPQYKGLENLYQKYQARGLVIVGVPSNDFGAQEPGDAQQISKVCHLNYGVHFPMAAKEVVKGDAAHPFYKWARTMLGPAAAPSWNFHKYLIDTNGRLVNYFPSNVEPQSARITRAVEALLPG